MSATTVTEAGIYDLPESAYHADPVPGGSMSSTVARRILATTPAQVEWDRTHPTHSDAFDLGSAVHALVLGAGAALVEVQADSWRTAAAKTARDAARAAGQTPLLSADLDRARAMAAAVAVHPVAGPLLGGDYLAERTIIWADPDRGIWRRAMLDALLLDGPRPLVVDLKTTSGGLDDASIAKSVADYGYHQQASWYLDAAESLGLVDAAFLFVFVQKAAPHLVRVVELDTDALAEGARANAAAMDLWAECRATGTWPGHDPAPALVSLPAWAYRKDI